MDDAGGAFLGWMTLSALRSLGLRAKRTVRAVMWTSEEVGPHGSTAFWEAAFEDGSIERYSCAFESDGGVFEPVGIGANANEGATEILRRIATDIGFEIHSSQRSGGADVAEAMIWGGVPLADLRSEEVAGFELGNSVNSGVLPAPGHFQGDYFFYHHSEGDTIEVLDSGQLDRAASMWTQFAYAIAELPDLLPRIDTLGLRSGCAESECTEPTNVTCMTSCMEGLTRPLVAAEHLDGEVFPMPSPAAAPGNCSGSGGGDDTSVPVGNGGNGSTAGGIVIGLIISLVAIALVLVLVSMRGSMRMRVFGMKFSLGNAGPKMPPDRYGAPSTQMREGYSDLHGDPELEY